MCIINLEVKDVSGTSIFVSMDKSKNRQLTIYANTVDTISPNNAMILPFPIRNTESTENQIQYYDMTSKSSFFEYLGQSPFYKMFALVF